MTITSLLYHNYCSFLLANNFNENCNAQNSLFFVPNSKFISIHTENQKHCENIFTEQEGIQYTAQLRLCETDWMISLCWESVGSFPMEASILSPLWSPQTSVLSSSGTTQSSLSQYTPELPTPVLSVRPEDGSSKGLVRTSSAQTSVRCTCLVKH